MSKNLFTKVFFSILLCLFFINVQSQSLGREKYKELTNNDFVEQIDLVSKPFEIGSGKLISPLRIIPVNNYLVIHDLESKKHLHVIDIAQKKYMGSYIDIGSGSNEMSNISVLEESGKDSFIIWDGYNKKYLYSKIEYLLNSATNFVSGTLDEKGYFYFLNYYEEVNKLWYAGHFNEGYRLYQKDIKSGKVKKYGKLLSAAKGKLNTIEVKNHLSAAKIEKGNNHIVFAYETVPLLEVFDQNTKEFISVFIPHSEPPIYYAVQEQQKVEIGSTNGSLYEFLDVKLTDKYIYAVYRGEEFTNTDPIKSVVYVFDYNLKPIKLYYLDKEVTSIAVYNDEIMYGLNIAPLIPGQKGKLLKYDLRK
ncbi:BF3164 family lipoprotein [Aquimarina rubra]|uniref:BF3164 family lipoprotein n=1 Tax=Aquimarina rubra TaxID=1920033 RepID=A0ABW5LBF3_9FLAO